MIGDLTVVDGSHVASSTGNCSFKHVQIGLSPAQNGGGGAPAFAPSFAASSPTVWFGRSESDIAQRAQRAVLVLEPLLDEAEVDTRLAALTFGSVAVRIAASSAFFAFA